MKARVLIPSRENIALACDRILNGEVIGMPTETVYGLAGNAFNEHAVLAIFKKKERPTFDPLIVHVSQSASRAAGSHLGALDEQAVTDSSGLTPAARERAEKLLAAFWPGPFTLVLPKCAAVPDLVTSGLSTVAVRMPRHPVAQALLDACSKPLAAPSANRFGRISPTSAQDVVDELGDRIELILDGGSCEIGLESTVVSISRDGALTMLRPGGVSAGEIERVAGVKLGSAGAGAGSGASGAGMAAPGMLESHYAPAKALHLLGSPVGTLKELTGIPLPRVLGLLVMSGDADSAATGLKKLTGRDVIARSLSPKGELDEMARRLFAELRFLDRSAAEIILAEPSPSDQGLGHAIADRLKRASRG